MSGIMETIHNARRMGFTFSHIREILISEHDFKSTSRNICDRYNRWCLDNGINPERRKNPPKRKRSGRLYERGDWQENAKKAGLLHLLDLVRAHGEVVFNRLTGEVVQGGFPNVIIPDVGTPIIVTPNYHGSLCGSAALTCAENSK